MNERVWWQAARIPVLLVLLAGVGQFQSELVEPVERVEGPTVPWLPWLVLVLLAAAFVAVALLGRTGGAGRVVAAVELVLAGVLALVPPIQWILWLGSSHWLVEWSGALTGIAFVQGLAVAWLVIAAHALVAGRGASSGGARESDSMAEEPDAAR